MPKANVLPASTDSFAAGERWQLAYLFVGKIRHCVVQLAEGTCLHEVGWELYRYCVSPCLWPGRYEGNIELN